MTSRPFTAVKWVKSTKIISFLLKFTTNRLSMIRFALILGAILLIPLREYKLQYISVIVCVIARNSVMECTRNLRVTTLSVWLDWIGICGLVLDVCSSFPVRWIGMDIDLWWVRLGEVRVDWVRWGYQAKWFWRGASDNQKLGGLELLPYGLMSKSNYFTIN